MDKFSMLPRHLRSLVQQFTKLPGIGPRQAARFVFYLLRNRDEILSLTNTLKSVDKNIILCDNCFLPAQNTNLPETVPGKFGDLLCSICVSPRRDKNTICVVEKETDALNFEKIGQYQGHYFVLGGFIDLLDKESIAHERLNKLIKKINAGALTPDRDRGSEPNSLELILALTPRREGDFTSQYIESQLKPLKERLKIKTTRLGRGLSSGAELEYADEDTLKNALEGRK